MEQARRRDHKKQTTPLLFLQRNASRCTSEINAQCYTSLVWPVIEYAAKAWDPYTARNIQQLEAVQRRAARFVTGDYKTTSSTLYQPDDCLSRLEFRTTEKKL